MNSRRWHLNKDYPTLERWFKLHKWDSPIPKDILPERGIIIEDICAAGLYTDTSSKLGYVYGIFSNPNIPKIKLFKAMKLCFNDIKLIKTVSEEGSGLIDISEKSTVYVVDKFTS